MNSKFTIKQMSPQLMVTNLKLAIEFYIQKLGFELEFRYEDFYAGLIKDGNSIHLKLTETAIQPKQYDDDAPLALTFLVENIHQIYEELSGHSVEVSQPLREMPYGTEFYIADPDGNVIAFLEY